MTEHDVQPGVGAFEQIVALLDYPMFVVTTRAGDERFAGRILHRFDLGDHVGHLTEPVAGSAPEVFGGLVTFADVKDLEPGHEA